MANVPASLIARLRAKAEWHAAEAARYVTAAEVLETEHQSGVVLPTENVAAGTAAAQSQRPSGAPNALTMIAEIVAEDDRAWPVAELLQEMLGRGWTTASAEPINTVRTGISRLMARGVLERVGLGTYRATQQGVAAVSEDLPILNGSGTSASTEALT